MGTGRTRSVSFLPFEEARELARSLKLADKTEWNNYAKSEDSPLDIPTQPEKSYAKEWMSWYDWLGKEETAWSSERVKELLKGLIESNVIFQWDEAVLYPFLLRKGIFNLGNTNRHSDFL
ncbi:hypothetical protein BH23THE1_BH23THE1_35820 [soil metagenome]